MESNNNSKKYIPINCGLYDQLEAFAVKKELLTIKYEEGSETLTQIDLLILDFKTKKIGEFGYFKLLNEEFEIRLDLILSVNGKSVKDEYGESCALLK